MNETDTSDANLIERYISGDKSTLPILVGRWHKIFCEKAFWILRDKNLSKDVAQECWITIIDKLPTLKDTNSFRAWALRIIYTKSIDVHKRRIRETLELKKVDKDAINESVVNENREKLKRKLLLAIGELPKSKQDIIRLFYVEEYSLKEISAFLEIPVGTAKSRLFKAREKLKLILNH